jgi:hypothetical protein
LVTEPAKIQMISTAEVRAQLIKSLGFTSEAGVSLSYYYSVLEDITAANPSNAQTLSRYIRACIEQNLAQASILSYIQILYFLADRWGIKSFEKVSKEDMLNYLLSLKKSETDDPTHKWIGTYNFRLMILYKFFRWLYNQNEPERKKWISPPCVQGIRALRKKEKSPYKPSDIWNDREWVVAIIDAKCTHYSEKEDDKQEPGPDRNIVNQMIIYLDYDIRCDLGIVLFADDKLREDIVIGQGEHRRILFLNCYPYHESASIAFEKVKNCLSYPT